MKFYKFLFVFILLVISQVNIFSEENQQIKETVLTLESLKNTLDPIINNLEKNGKVNTEAINKFYREAENFHESTSYGDKKHIVEYLFSTIETILRTEAIDNRKIHGRRGHAPVLGMMPYELLLLGWEVSPKNVTNQFKKWKIGRIPSKVNEGRFMNALTVFFLKAEPSSYLNLSISFFIKNNKTFLSENNLKSLLLVELSCSLIDIKQQKRRLIMCDNFLKRIKKVDNSLISIKDLYNIAQAEIKFHEVDFMGLPMLKTMMEDNNYTAAQKSCFIYWFLFRCNNSFSSITKKSLINSKSLSAFGFKKYSGGINPHIEYVINSSFNSLMKKFKDSSQAD